MNSRHFFGGAALIAAFALTGCIEPASTVDTKPAATAAKKPTKTRGLITFTYAANSKVYEITTKYDGLARSYGTELRVVSGTPLTGDLAEDAEAQNTIRDAFRAQNICGTGFHPGILGFNYGYYDPLGAWVAQVRCSEKVQSNI
jgi:hypothetical protein